ncbi:MAG: PaaI family thioesterase [Stappiaceae bacterium]
MKPIMSIEEITQFLDERFPQINFGGRAYFVEAIDSGTAMVRLRAVERHLRPGGTVSGPSMMELADLAAYVVILAHIGPVALAVTTNFTINFLRKPAPGDLVCDCRLLKLGRRLAVVECGIRPENNDELVAQAMATYSIPK